MGGDRFGLITPNEGWHSFSQSVTKKEMFFDRVWFFGYMYTTQSQKITSIFKSYFLLYISLFFCCCFQYIRGFFFKHLQMTTTGKVKKSFGILGSPWKNYLYNQCLQLFKKIIIYHIKDKYTKSSRIQVKNG